VLATKPQAKLLKILQRDVNKLSEKDQGYLKREADKHMAACEAKMDEHASSNAALLVSRPGPNITCDDWFRAIESLLSDAPKP